MRVQWCSQSFAMGDSDDPCPNRGITKCFACDANLCGDCSTFCQRCAVAYCSACAEHDCPGLVDRILAFLGAQFPLVRTEMGGKQ